MKDNMDKFLFKWSNLTSLGVPSSTIGAVLDNEQVYKHSPTRFNFYMQVMESIANPNPRILETVIKKENQTRFQREQIDDKIKNIVQYFKRPEAKMDPNLLQTIQAKLSGNMLTRNIKVEATGGAVPEMSGGTLLSDMSNRLFNENDGNEGITAKFKSLLVTPSPTPTPEQVISTYKNDPYYSPANEKVEWADRAIFAGLTYIIRALALFLTEWSIYSGYIKKFTDAFAMYFGMYTCIFLLVVFLTNARKEDMIFRMVFFYINSQSDDGKGIWRIVVHLICILMLLPIPYVVKEYREFDQPPVLSFADKATILSGVEKFSMYTWILTSVVALNV